MTTDAPELGLRERKRLATRRAIQLAVLELVAERGLENVTVDEISRVADVSPRTFFNYFTSKEEAIIGEAPSLPGVLAVEEFVAAGSDDLTNDFELLALRRELMKQHPQLFALRMATMRTFEEELGAVVERRLALDDPALGGDRPELEQRARLITLVAFAAMRHAWACWADNGGSPVELSERLRSSFDQLGDLLVPKAVG